MFIGAVACGYKYAHFTRPTFPSSVVAFQLHGSEDEDRSWKGKPSAVRRQASGGKRQASGVDRICTPTIWAFFLNIGVSRSSYNFTERLVSASSTLLLTSWWSGNRWEITLSSQTWTQTARNASAGFDEESALASWSWYGTHDSRSR